MNPFASPPDDDPPLVTEGIQTEQYVVQLITAFLSGMLTGIVLLTAVEIWNWK